MKKILFIFTANQYNVVNEMVWRIADELEQQCGYTVGRYRLDEYDIVKKGDWDIIFSAQAIEFSKLEEADGRIHIIWLVDHPRYLMERFIHYPEHDKVYIGCVDRTHVDYLRNYYSLPHVFFAPHFAWKGEHMVPFQKRGYEVFFPASAVRWESVAERYKGLEGALKTIVDYVIEFLLKNPEYPLETGFEQVLLQFGEKDYRELAKACMELAGEYVDFYLRITTRMRIIRALLHEGVTVTVCGRGWEEAGFSEQERANLQIIGEELPYTEVIEKMADSKAVLNVMPWFKDGSHERVLMALMNGAVSVTDASGYIKEIFGENGVVYYDICRPELAAKEIKKRLQSVEQLESLAERGKRLAEEKGTVKNWGSCIEQIVREQSSGI